MMPYYSLPSVRCNDIKTPDLQSITNLTNDGNALCYQVGPHTPGVNDDCVLQCQAIAQHRGPGRDPDQGSNLPSPRIKGLVRDVGEHQGGGHFHKQHHCQVQACSRDVKPNVWIGPPNDKKAQRMNKNRKQCPCGTLVFGCHGGELEYYLLKTTQGNGNHEQVAILQLDVLCDGIEFGQRCQRVVDIGLLPKFGPHPIECKAEECQAQETLAGTIDDGHNEFSGEVLLPRCNVEHCKGSKDQQPHLKHVLARNQVHSDNDTGGSKNRIDRITAVVEQESEGTARSCSSCLLSVHVVQCLIGKNRNPIPQKDPSGRELDATVLVVVVVCKLQSGSIPPIREVGADHPNQSNGGDSIRCHGFWNGRVY
mmetsp:Transcript_26170/g.71785  ORF Transcript_26170/g.71785 Transcript_26170/m.71785 type:complete len:366 (+) Transcript_26170:138-1235(+)